MASQVLIANPSIKLNNEIVKYIPESLKVNDGAPEIKVTSLGVNGEVGIGSDQSTAISMVSFDMRISDESNALYSAWKNLRGAIRIEVTGLDRSFDEMTLTNVIVQELSSEGKVSLEFSGPALASTQV